jgi:protein-tyrosine phosphatase
VIDLHAHILPGFDDGVRSLEEARELARTAAAEGVTAIAATPHVRDDYPTTPEQMERGVERLRADFEREGIPIEVLCGGEIAFDRVDALDDDELQRFALARARHVLVEFPYAGWPLEIRNVAFRLQARGFTPVLAHPERNGAVQADPARLRSLVEAGALVQLTAGAVAGALGRAARATARALLAGRLAHLIASDAHGPAVRRSSLAAGAEALDDRFLAQWLTVDVPAAIAAGDRLPPRPERRRRWPARRRR